MSTPLSDEQITAIKARAVRAHEEIAAICEQGRDRWRMRIPAQPDRDSDLILSASITDAETLLAEVERLKAETAQTVQRQEINRLKDGLVSLIRAWRAHDDDTGDYGRCADEIEGLLNGGALC